MTIAPSHHDFPPPQPPPRRPPPVTAVAAATPAQEHRSFDEMLYERWRAQQHVPIAPVTTRRPALPAPPSPRAAQPTVSARRLRQAYAAPRNLAPLLNELA